MDLTQKITIWYSINKRDLPWRKNKNPYHIWLSEIILQQTQVKQGLPYYEDFVKTFPTIQDLANAPQEQILKLWQGLGYYSRARNLHYTAQYIVTELNGNFPTNYKDLLKLKGIGEYTASAIASICFNEPKAVVDGNVYRVLSRYFGVELPINSNEGIKEYKQLAQSLIDHKEPGNYNQGIMEFGAIQCKPQNPDCQSCPLNSGCVALQKNWVEKLPIKLKKTKVETKYFNFLVFISKDRKTVFEKRDEKGIWHNLYQFPLIETKTTASLKEIENSKLLKAYVGDNLYEITSYNEDAIIHKLTHRHLHTKFWIVELNELPQPAIPFNNVKQYPTPRLISRFLETFKVL